MTLPELHTLQAEDASAAVEVLAEAFGDYPAMRFFLAESGDQYAGHLKTLLHFFVMCRLLRRETLLGIGGRKLGGVAMVSRPEATSPPAIAALREETWERIGPDAKNRYEDFGAATSSVGTSLPRLHMGMIGVRPSAAGQGLGRRLLDRVHALAEGDGSATGVSLSTESESNVRLYEHFGYRLTGHADVTPELRSWGMFRPNDTADA